MTDDELKAQFAENRRHFEAVAERMEKKFDTLAEGFLALDERVARRFNAVEASIERTATPIWSAATAQTVSEPRDAVENEMSC